MHGSSSFISLVGQVNRLVTTSNTSTLPDFPRVTSYNIVHSHPFTLYMETVATYMYVEVYKTSLSKEGISSY